MNSKFVKLDYDTSKERQCSRHGVQPISAYYKCAGKSRHGKAIDVYRCILCTGERRAARHAANPGESRKSVKKWRKKNPDKLRLINGKYYKVNRVKLNAAYKKQRDKNRLICIVHYGGPEPKCACCGENRLEFLSIDHIKGKGNAHRKEIKRWGSTFYKWLIQNRFPRGFRVLCHNCNFSLGAYGYCPHTHEGPASLPADPSVGLVAERSVSPS
jgi:hypothetical protein